MEMQSSFFTQPNSIVYLQGLEHGRRDCIVMRSLYNTFSRHFLKEKRLSKGRRSQNRRFQKSRQKTTDFVNTVLRHLLPFDRLSVCNDKWLADKLVSQQMLHTLIKLSLSRVPHHADLSTLRVLTKLKHVHLYFHNSPRNGTITVIIEDLVDVLPNSIQTLSLMNISILTNNDISTGTNSGLTHPRLLKINISMCIFIMAFIICYSRITLLFLPFEYGHHCIQKK